MEEERAENAVDRTLGRLRAIDSRPAPDGTGPQPSPFPPEPVPDGPGRVHRGSLVGLTAADVRSVYTRARHDRAA
ncbi:MAG: hypothetical protein L0H64_15005 [Pseudonocardia sp.]|nr:hypothetical protein [Pseudonocardia sp.]